MARGQCYSAGLGSKGCLRYIESLMRHGCSQPRGRIERELLGQILGSRADYVYRDAGRPLADVGETLGQEGHGGYCLSTRLYMRRSFRTGGNYGGGRVATMVWTKEEKMVLDAFGEYIRAFARKYNWICLLTMTSGTRGVNNL